MAVRLSNAPGRASDAVDEARLWQRLMTMAKIGARPDGGVDRQALTPEDAAARVQLVAWATARGYGCSTDPIGNLFVRREGRDKTALPVVTGSHLDTQPTGGKFDGAYGVLAGFEALQALDEAGIETLRPIEVVAWCNEEGSRFAPGAMGSASFAGQMKLETLLEAKDWKGVRLGDALAEVNAALPDLASRPLGFPAASYVEAHIEQGPVLEREKRTIGVVTGIQGSRWFVVEVTGSEAHAGTAPLRTRRDALKAAMSMIGALEKLMEDDTDTIRFTVGRLEVKPNSPNTVPGRVMFTIDFRHPDVDVLTRLGDRIETVIAENARHCSVTVTPTFNAPPCSFDAGVIGAIDEVARELDLPSMPIPSGAFHDAKYMAEICPSGMIFVPCEDGISHNPVENATPADLAAGARVLADVLARLANR